MKKSHVFFVLAKSPGIFKVNDSLCLETTVLKEIEKKKESTSLYLCQLCCEKY